MKKALWMLMLLAFATIALAGTYTVTTNAAQDTRLERHRVRSNKATCASVSLPVGCTQAQARNINPDANIYSNVEDLIDRMVVKNFTDGLKNDDTRDDAAQFCVWFKAASAAQQNNACALAGLPNGCEICP